MGNEVLTQLAQKWGLNICKYWSPIYVNKLCSNEPHFYTMYLATDIVDPVQNFPYWTVLWQVEVEGENWVEEGLKVAVTEAKEVEMEAMEVAIRAEEVVGTIKVVVQQARKTFGQNAALEFLVTAQVESQKQVQKELQQHYCENY